MSRHWSVTLEVRCSARDCTHKDAATLDALSAEVARKGVIRVLRERGWSVGGPNGMYRDDWCPSHCREHPACQSCGKPTPEQYGRDALRQGGPRYCCDICWRKYHEPWLAKVRGA